MLKDSWRSNRSFCWHCKVCFNLKLWSRPGIKCWDVLISSLSFGGFKYLSVVLCLPSAGAGKNGKITFHPPFIFQVHQLLHRCCWRHIARKFPINERFQSFAWLVWVLIWTAEAFLLALDVVRINESMRSMKMKWSENVGVWAESALVHFALLLSFVPKNQV